MVKLGNSAVFSWALALAGFLTGAIFSDSVYAKAVAGPDAEIVSGDLHAVIDTKTLNSSEDIGQLPSVMPPFNQDLAATQPQETAAENPQPQMVASLESSVLDHRESGSPIDASTVLEGSNGVILSIPETKIKPTEPGEQIVTSAEQMLPARGISHQQVQETGGSVTASRKSNLSGSLSPSPSSNEDDAGLPYAIILALFALISLIPVARRDDHNHHRV